MEETNNQKGDSSRNVPDSTGSQGGLAEDPSDVGARTPAQFAVADGGVTPAAIQARQGGDPTATRLPEALPQQTQPSQHSTEEAKAQSQQARRQSTAGSRGSRSRLKQSQTASDPTKSGENPHARTQRKLVPIRGSRGRSGSLQGSREENRVRPNDSRTMDHEEWDQAHHLKAQGRATPMPTDQSAVVSTSQQNLNLASARRPSSKPSDIPHLDEAMVGGQRNLGGVPRLPSLADKLSKKGAIKADHSRQPSVSFHDVRTAAGLPPGDGGGTRALNYYEDDSSHLNQAYVERVLGQAGMPLSTHHRSKDQATNQLYIQQTNSRQGRFGNRHLSVDQAAMRGGRAAEVTGALGAPRPSHDQSQMSGVSLNENSLLIQEVRRNNYQKVSQIMEQFVQGKHDSGTVTGRDTQQRKRNIKNTFQTGQDGRLRSNLDKTPTKMTEHTDYPGAVGPKREITMPKQLVLYQLSKNMDAAMVEQSLSNSAFQVGSGISDGRTYPMQPETVKSSKMTKSFLDFIEGSVQGPEANDSIPLNLQKSPFYTKSLRTIDPNPNSILETVHENRHQNAFGNPDESILQVFEQSPNQSQLQQPGMMPYGEPSQSPALSNFHITDLLERSIIGGANEQRDQNKLRQIVEFYKRAVKGDKEIGTKKEVMIRNYRLHIVKDVDKEIDPEQRSLFTLNKGTCIHVSNSIVKPEIHKYLTKVSDKLEQAYPFLLEEMKPSPLKRKVQQPGYFHRRSQSVQSGVSGFTDGTRQYHHAPIHQMEDDEAQLYQEEVESQINEDRQSETRQSQNGRISKRHIDQSQEDQQNLAEFVDDGMSSRPFTATDAVELEAINSTNKIFDRWLRNIMSRQSSMLASPERPRLQNGRNAAPKLLDINWQIAIQNKSLIKEKPLPLEMLTNMSFYNDTPYRQLQMLMVNQDIRDWYSRFILKTQSVKTYNEIVMQELQSMNFSDTKIAIDFARHHLTHLDPVIFQDDNLPLELFLDYETWIKSFAKDIKNLKLETELIEDEDELPGIPAKTDYYNKQGQRIEIDVRVLDFDPYKARFFVKNSHKNIETWRSRLYIRRDDDQREHLEKEKEIVMKRKAETLHYLRLHRLIAVELTKRYDYLRLDNLMLQKILARIYVDLFKFNPDSVRKIILQIEALFVFAILKSTLNSQKNDPFIKQMLRQYKIPLDTPALTQYTSPNTEKKNLQGLQDYNMKSIKVELDHNSLLLMDEKYIKLPMFLNSLTLRTIGAHKLFKYPFDINLLLAQNTREFRKTKKAELEQQVNIFPLHHGKFVHAQNIMSQNFHQIAKFRWAESIQQEIWGFVKDDFNFDLARELREDQIDPVLLRLFYQLKLYMQTVMFDHFESALRDYLRFLLSFILRDPEMKESKTIEEVKYNPWIRLSYKDNAKLMYKRGEMVNDIDLIPLGTKPMIKIQSQIEDHEGANPGVKKQKVVTSPPLAKVSEDLFSIIENMHNSLQKIDRIDGILFPLLKLDDPYLLVPDVKTNEKLSHYIAIIERLIEGSLKTTEKEIRNIKGYMEIFDKRPDNIIMDLKKRSYALQQDMSDGEGEPEKKELGSDEEEAEDEQAEVEAAPAEADEEEEEEDDFDDDDDDDDAEEGYAGNDMAFKSVEIDDGLMKGELFGLRDLIWKVLENIHNQYDFGMVFLDCQLFKSRILDHIKSLIEHLETYIKNLFSTTQKGIQNDIVSVRGKLDMDVQSIDDVIMLLDYIESLKKQDNKIGDISADIDLLAKRMDYIESVKILFPSDQYDEFLNIRNWPKTFKQYIEQRREQLLEKKQELYQEMSKEIEEVKEKIKGFGKEIKELLLQGLMDRELTYDEQDDDLDSDASQKESVDHEEVARRAEAERLNADGKTFKFLSEQKEVKMQHLDFKPSHVEGIYHNIEHLKSNFDEVERATALINKRETLLGVQKTQFNQLRAILDDLKPLYDLWFVASRFARTMPQWIEDKFDLLDAGVIETKIDEWINELKRLQRTDLVANNEKQQEIQKFMFGSLTHFKLYGPMLRTLRTKGLRSRHWKQIAANLKFTIDPSNITLYKLIMLELYTEEKLKTIKLICEVATKEYAVELSLLTLEKEMKAVEFEFQVQVPPSGEGIDPDLERVVVVTRLPELIIMFEEFFLRASVLKTNPNIRNFFEKLLDVEKIIKNVVELINEWALFQRNFVYLNAIFCLDEIAKSLPAEAKFFQAVQQLYITTTQQFQIAPQVFKINFKENFLTILMKNNQDCEVIRSGLMDFLEKKRTRFPRLFFLSNEELIEIFGQGPNLVDSILEGTSSTAFISNLFEGVDHVLFHPTGQDITHMYDRDGEEVPLIQDVMTRNLNVDSWLKKFQEVMMLTIKSQYFKAFAAAGNPELSIEDWITNYAGQAVFLSSQVWFTMKMNSIFEGVRLQEDQKRAMRFAGAAAGNDPSDDDDEGEEADLPMNAKKPQPPPVEDGDGPSIPVEDPEVVEAQLYEEEVNRQIAADWDDGDTIQKAELEETMRLKRRFRVHKGKTAPFQFNKAAQEINTTIIAFTAMVRKRLKNNVRASTVALLTVYVHFRDILNGLLRDRVYKADEFKWQMQFKFDMKYEKMCEVVQKRAEDASRKHETQKIEVECEVFNNVRIYGFEYLGNCSRLVVTPLTERCQRSLLVALQYHYGGAPEGPFGTGKTETSKDLARQIAKLCFVLNCSANYEYAGVCRFFKGLASSGAWVIFDEFNRMEPHILSLISQVIISIQGAIKRKDTHLQLDEAKIVLVPDCAIFITLNPGYAGRAELPMNLKTLFRSISMVVPDSVFITEILLYASGFIGAQQLAKKIVTVQQLANVIMKKTDIAHDFGLRSIKAIIGIAEKLKLQAQNILDSDLTEIIDDYSMKQVPYQTDEIIRDVMTVTQARITKATDVSKDAGSPKKGKGKKTKGQGSFYGGEGELVKIDEQNAENDMDSNASPMPKGLNQGGTNKDIDKRQGLDSIDEQIQGKEGEGGGFRDSQQSIPGEQTELQNGKGALYNQLWSNQRFAERQLKTVYRQIGIDPDQHYEEEELEEYIILKAVRDFNHSKFATDEHIIIEGIIKDIFQGAVPDLDKPIQDYGNLQEALHQSFELCKIDYAKNMKLKALQMYEIQRSKHGCILCGEPQSGKSTLVFLLESAINKAAINEFMLTVSDKRRTRLQELAVEYEAEVMETLRKTQTSNNGKPAEALGGGAKKKSKKNDKDAQAKKLLAQWQEMYKRTKLTMDEIDEIRDNLVIKGVTTRRLNPKGMTIDELFGTFNKESHEWHEGLFTQHYRDFSSLKGDKKKWILLDGPIDFMWVENLNSMLDDNKRMSLPNGESIKMSDGMCILLETNNLRNVTPATVSRCGLIYLHRRETCSPKAIFNKWLRNLPPNLAEHVEDLERSANFLMVEPIAVFLEDEKAGRIAYKGIDLHWVMQNFIRILQCFVCDYFVEYEKSNMGALLNNPNELGKSLFNLSMGNKWTDTVPDPNMTEYPESEAPASAVPQSRGSVSRSSQRKVKTPDARQRELEKHTRLPCCTFIEPDIRIENALKFTPIWLEAFVVFAMVWAFYPVLSEQGRKSMDARLQAKYNTARTDFGIYQKEKKRRMAEKNKEKSRSNKESVDKNKSLGKASLLHSKKSLTSDKSASLVASLARQDRDSQPNNDGLSPFWSDELDVKPMLISDYPENQSFFDFFFNLESSAWNVFNLDMARNDASIRFTSLIPSQKKVQNFFVPSKDSVRYSYLLECFVTNQFSTLVIGAAGSGRSALLRETLFTNVFDYTKGLQTDHITMSAHTDSVVFKENVERLLEWRLDKKTGQRRLRPHLDNKLIVYVEDLHLANTDLYGDQSAVETIRDYLTQKAWLSSRKRRLRDVEDLSFYACMATNAPETAKVSTRVLHRFNLIALDDPTVALMNDRYTLLAELMVQSFPSSLQLYASNIAESIVYISRQVQLHLKPTPMKAHYTFNWRDLQKLLLSVGCIEGNSLKKQADVMKLVYHECYRNYGDRLLMTHDQKWFVDFLKEACSKHFWVVDQIEVFEKTPEKKKEEEEESEGGEGKKVEQIDPKRKDQFLWPIKDPDSLYFSLWNPDLEGYYQEVTKIDDVQKLIQGALVKYNDSNERVRLDLMLFNQVNRLMLKMLRAISIPNGHLINVAMKGYGMNSVIKLVAMSAGHVLKELDVYEGFQMDEWQGELRRSIIYCGNEDKHVTFAVDEYKMMNDQMYKDLECILKNGIASEITRKPDIMLALANIYQQQKEEKNAAKFGLDAANGGAELTKEQQEEAERQQEDQQHEFIADNKRMMMKWPHIQAELYQIFLNRVKQNFHLVLQYTPTGGNFREKIAQNKELMYLCQMIFMNDLPQSELVSLGYGFFNLEAEKMENKAAVDGSAPENMKPEQLTEWARARVMNEYSVSNDKDSSDRVLLSVVKMYLIAQDMTKKFAEDTGQILYMTPVMFLSVFKQFKKLLKERQNVVKDIAERYEQGLDKIRKKQNEIYGYHQELERKSPVLQEKQRALMRVIEEIESEFSNVRGQRDQLRRDEREAEEQTEEALKIKEQCEETLNKIIPSLNEAMNRVQTLNKHDIAELRSLKKPPKVVKLVMQTVCMLLGVAPQEKKSKKTGKLKLSYWKAAQGKEVLGNPRFQERLVDFDRSSVTPETMMEVEDVLTNGNYSYERAHKASAAAAGIFKWVKVTREYFYIVKEIEPRREAFMLSQKQYEEKKTQLEEKSKKINHLDSALTGLQDHQKSKDAVLEDLQAEIQDCSIRKKRADILLRGLSSEKQKWIVCTRMLSSKFTTVTGDVLLSAGYISLLGGFNQRFRGKVVQRWAKTLIEEGFQCSKEFVFTELFGDSYKIRKWHINQLPSDSMSVNNALVVEKTKRFSLLIDPQLQGITWLKNQYDDGGSLTLTKQNDPQFKKLIEIAIDMGRTVIVEQIAEKIGMNLQSLMKKQVTKYGGQRMIVFCRKQYKFDKNFKLFVVSTNPKPHFDVNITNHVTFLNFSVNVESLQAQMLGLVVVNERKDLEDTFNENSREAFESIKSLKDIEGAILGQLDQEVTALLGDESLIKTLSESKHTAEYVASKLKNIAQTNQFIQRSRDIYAPVAYRAAILYFVVQDLLKVNHMYQFSLSWFKVIFSKSLELTNAMKDDSKDQDSDDGKDDTLKLLNNSFSVNERIDLLMKTFTQELFKKITMAVFEEDKKLVTTMLVMRVMQAENFIEGNLFEFLISGAKKVSTQTKVPREIDTCPWLTNMMWADLQYLATLKPFNKANLLGNMISAQDKWSKFYNVRGKPLTYEDLPNKELLDLRFFSQQDEDELEEETRPLGPNGGQTDAQSELLKATDVASMAGKTAGQTNSRVGSRGGMTRTESEILNDPNIWNLSDSEEDNAPGRGAVIDSDDDNKSYHSDEDNRDNNFAEADQIEMARYLVEQAPSADGYGHGRRSNIDSLRRKTASERTEILRREKAVKGLTELAILRCIRPDHLVESMERFVLNVLDPNYFEFSEDILAPLMAKKAKLLESSKKENKHNSMSAAALGNKVLSTSKMSRTNESQSGLNKNDTQTKLNPGQASGNSMNETQQSANKGMSGTQYTNNSSKQRISREEQEKLDKEQREKKGGLNNIKNLIRVAFEDSDQRSPIFFLITHSVNIQDIVTEFHQRQPNNSSLKLQYFSLGKGLEEMVEERMAKAAQNGDWIILENLHLVEDWLPTFEEKMNKWKGPELNARFRMWITCVPVDSFPATILEKSIKVALQPPRTIKTKMERMLFEQEKQTFFRKSGKNANYHKNLFFGLAYLHSILESRKKYGTLGFHVPYKFDFSDFEVSNAQLASVIKNNSGDLMSALEMLKYFYANINYAGKIQRVEDQQTLNAILQDLFNDKVSFTNELPAELDSSHYGIPPENCDFLGWCDRTLPERDNYAIYGLNWNVECSLLRKEVFILFDELFHLESQRSGGGPEVANQGQNNDIEMNSQKTSLRSSTLDGSGQVIDKMLEEKKSILNLFIELQKLLNSSSLDKTVTHGGKRYDHNIDQEILPMRDLHDQEVANIAGKLLLEIDAQFDMDVIQEKFPIMYLQPLNNVVNRELTAYKILLTVIRESVADLLANIDGKYPRPFEIEALWSSIQMNKVPDKWKAVSFQSCYDSLADYIVELGLKLEFWKKVVVIGADKLPSFWLGALFDPKSYLTGLIQTRARRDAIAMKELRNEYQVQDFDRPEELPTEANVCYIHGLWLEGADWDPDRRLLVETAKPTRFVPFPAIKIRTLAADETSDGQRDPAHFAQFSQKGAKKGKKKKETGGGRGKNKNTGAENAAQLTPYACPLFKSTLRLSTGLVSSDNAPVEYIYLESLEEPGKWTKRAVALVLEQDRNSQ